MEESTERLPRHLDPEAIKRSTIKSMKELGTYKKQYDQVVVIYSGLVAQYNRLNEEMQAGLHKIEVVTGQGGAKKSPAVLTLETLRKDILAYSDRLCLNPKSLESVTVEEIKENKLDALMKKMK